MEEAELREFLKEMKLSDESIDSITKICVEEYDTIEDAIIGDVCG